MEIENMCLGLQCGRSVSAFFLFSHPSLERLTQSALCLFSFCLSREVVAVCLSLFDRYLATRGNQASGHVALLVALTTLHIAMKLNSTYSRTCGIALQTLTSLSRGQFSPLDVEAQERKIVDALDWKLHPPTPMNFLVLFVRLLPTSANTEIVLEQAAYQTQQAVFDQYFVAIPSSTIALAALLNAFSDVNVTGEDNQNGPGNSMLTVLLEKLERFFNIRPLMPELQQAKCRLKSITPTSAVAKEQHDDERLDSCYSPVTCIVERTPVAHSTGFTVIAGRNDKL